MNDKVLQIKRSTLVDIANEVRAKTGSTDLIKVGDLDDAVKELSGGGGGIVEVDVLPNPYLCTPVPNSGYVEKVYFDTGLSVDAVVAELEKLTYDDESPVNILLCSDATEVSGVLTPSDGVCAMNFNDMIMILDGRAMYNAISDGGNMGSIDYNEVALFSNSNTMTSFVGWNPEFNGEVTFNTEASNNVSGYLIGAENDKIANLFYLDKQPNLDVDPEPIYKLPDETLWIYEDGWKQLKKTKKLTIKNVAGYEISMPFYLDAENMFDADGNANESEEFMLTFAKGETKTFYVGSSVVLKGDWYCDRDNRVNVVTSGFTIANIGRYDVITVTGDNASVTIQQEEM